MQYMNTVTPTNNVKDPKRAAAVFDPDLPDASTNTGEWSAIQRLLSKLQQIEFVTNVDTNRPRKLPDNIEGVTVPIDVL